MHNNNYEETLKPYGSINILLQKAILLNARIHKKEIYRQDRTTVAVVEYTPANITAFEKEHGLKTKTVVGVATRNPGDQEYRKLGRDLAFCRALQKIIDQQIKMEARKKREFVPSPPFLPTFPWFWYGVRTGKI